MTESKKILFIGFFMGAALIGTIGWVTEMLTSPTPHSSYPYCWEFDPTTDITPFELASIIRIWGGGGGTPESRITAWGDSPEKLYSNDRGAGDFIDRQFKRCGSVR